MQLIFFFNELSYLGAIAIALRGTVEANVRRVDEYDDEVDVTPAADEVTRYQNCVVDSAAYPGLLQWWKENQLQYPGLAQLAKRRLCIQTSSAPVRAEL